MRRPRPDWSRNSLLTAAGWLLFGLWVAGEFVSHIRRKSA